MAEDCKELKKFYDKIFSWNYLLKFGYYDFIENYNKEINKDNHTEILYGKANFIDPEFFNMDQISKEIDEIKQSMDKYKNVPTQAIKFFIPKDNKTRRVLKFPNLFSYCKLVDEIIKSQDQEINILSRDKNSTSRFFNITPYNFETTSQIRDQLLIGFTKFYKTDFSNFYHSFYTHAIVWLIEDKFLGKVYRYDWSYLGNRLDKLIEQCQDNETHGVPTGSLVTRIIMELCMASFDRQLRTRLGNDVGFVRYVDDIYFGYNNDKDLLRIKTAMSELTSMYSITLNSNKCKSVTYLDIGESSKLINYFYEKQIDLSDPKIIAKQLNNFFLIANHEMLEKIKGSDKLIFTSLRYFIENVKSNSDIENLLDAFIYGSNKNRKAFIDKLLELVILDPRLIVYFIQMSNVIYLKENKIHNFIVTGYLRKRLREKDFFHRLKNNLKNNILNSKSQEAYAILLLFSKFNISLSLHFIIQILEKITEFQNEDIDDFSLILLINAGLTDNKTKDNKELLYEMLFQLDKLVSYDYLSFKKINEKKNHQKQQPYEKYFTYNHWLLKYDLFSRYINDLTFQKRIMDFYKAQGTQKGLRFLDFSDFKKYANQHDINQFYLDLLNKKILLTDMSKIYNSNDI